MNRRHRLLVAGAAGASLLGLAAFSLRPMRAPPEPPSAPEAAGPKPVAAPWEAPAPAAPAPAAEAPARLGRQRDYEVDLNESVTLAAATPRGARPGEQASMIKTLHASWLVTCVVSERGRARYRGLLHDVKAAVNGQAYPEGEYLKDFARPFFFDTDAEGKVTALAFEPQAGSDARGTIKSLVARSQVVVHRAAAAPPSWVTLEDDPTGEYEADYSRLTDAFHLRKERTRYLRVATEQGLRGVAELGAVAVKDDTRITLTAEGDLDEIASTTETDLRFGDGMPVVRSRTTLAAHLLVADTDASALAAMNAEWRRARVVDMASPPEKDDAGGKDGADARPAKRTPLADLERDLAKVPKGATGLRGAQLARLQADFRVHPEDAQKIVSYVQTASVADGQSITAALGGAGTPEALRALVGIATTPATAMDVRVNAIGALAISGASSSDTVQALKQMTADGNPDIHAASTLALGAAAAAVRATDPSAYQDAVGLLLGALAAATTPDEMILALRGLGNSGDPRVLAAAEQAMSGQPASVRVAAVAAVRFVAGTPTDDFLRSVMQNDPDEPVRIQALATVEMYRAVGDFLPTLGGVLRAEPDALVRHAALHALNVIKAMPEAIALLAFSARSDPSQEIRAYAQAILDAPSQR
jgi:HEAT repeats